MGDEVEQITISLHIVNTYELYEEVVTTVTDEVIDAPPAGSKDGDDAFADWAQDELYPFTGAGHTDGKSWYDVTVTACSDPSLVGLDFMFGDY